MKRFISLITSFFIVLSLTFEGLPYMFYPTIEFDLKNTKGKISSRACGYLYGLAEEGVPSEEMVKSLEISSVSQKVKDGLQHPIGDVDHVSNNLNDCDYIVVYLQDSYSTWYYNHKEIEEMRNKGTYDWEKFVRDDFYPKVTEKVADISKQSYSDRIVYCPYNECDNAIWFGTVTDEGYWAFDQVAKQRFYTAWKKTCELIRSIDKNAKIGGPGYFDYNIEKLTDFLEFCKENDCLPNVLIYHELSSDSSAFWEDHVTELKAKEKEMGIEEIPIIVTEYGTMEECGAPAPMLHYIQAIEHSGVYGNVAYWRLANNLCDTCTDANIPNSNWWLFKWYCDMNGDLINSKIIDIKHSDFANTIKYERNNFHYTQLEGLGSFDKENLITDILCGSCDYDFQISLKNVKDYMEKTVKITVEAVTFEGISGEAYAPEIINEYTQKVTGNFKIKVNSSDKNAVYHITVKPYANEALKGKTDLPVRYEFENGKLLGSAYTYDSAYATTGEAVGMCGGFENEGDGISLDFITEADGECKLALIYGNSNDGSKPSDRKDTLAYLSIDGKEEIISLPNTIKSEYTKKFYITKNLSKGKHNITLKHKDGTFVVDSLLVYKNGNTEVYNKYEPKNNSHLVIAPSDGYYLFAESGNKIYLKRGLNYVDLGTKPSDKITKISFENYKEFAPKDVTVTGGSHIDEIGKSPCITGISSDGGKGEITVNASKAGKYALTFTYSNNEEGGYHDYNVDLIEEYITVCVNGKEYTLWCVNTQSDYNFNTATVYVDLTSGENQIEFYNNGSVKFNNKTAISPNIAKITLNPYTAE